MPWHAKCLFWSERWRTRIDILYQFLHGSKLFASLKTPLRFFIGVTPSPVSNFDRSYFYFETSAIVYKSLRPYAGIDCQIPRPLHRMTFGGAKCNHTLFCHSWRHFLGLFYVDSFYYLLIYASSGTQIKPN